MVHRVRLQSREVSVQWEKERTRWPRKLPMTERANAVSKSTGDRASRLGRLLSEIWDPVVEGGKGLERIAHALCIEMLNS